MSDEDVIWRRAADYSRTVASLEGGKRIGGHVYLHVSALGPTAADLVSAVRAHACIDASDFQVVKFSSDAPRLSLLKYPGFMTRGFPILCASWLVDFEARKVVHRAFEADSNPPVLHRKELTLAPGHPRRSEFEQLTRSAQTAGLFEDAKIIGHQVQWEEELRARGLAVLGHRLVPKEEAPEAADRIQRHRTALRRHGLSTPMQALWRHGFMENGRAVMDYGCGQGDDVELLESKGVPCSAWDPHFRPQGELRESEVVNLGFVLNVIEDPVERREALEGAFGLAKTVLAVAALIGGRTAYERHRLFRDGVLTSRGTFQKYFTQAELGEYIGQVLGRAPVPIAPGIYFVFRSDEDEQAFLVSKQSSRLRPMARCEARRRHRERKPSRPVRPRDTRWAQHSELLEAFWDAWLEFGRPLKHGEYSREGELREKLGTPNRVMRYLRTERGEDDLQVAAEARRADLLVYLALNLFARRRSFYGLSDRLQRDVKWFFGSYAEATAGAKRLLFSIADTRAIHAECVRAAGDGLGWLDGQHSLQLDSRLINDLPPILRVYVGCAAILYGDPEEADLVKIHIQSGKLTLLLYDDYLGEPTPKLIERVKINLRRRTLRFYEYGGRWPSAPLLLKSRFMNESCPEYASQMAFDQRWRELQRGAADV